MTIIARLPRSWIAILGLVALGSIGMLVAKPMFVAATATNPAAILRLAGLLTVVLAMAWFVESRVEHQVVRAVLIGVPVVAIGWWMVAPAFTDVRVDQALPTSSADLGLATASSSPTAGLESSDGPTTSATPSAAPSATPSATPSVNPSTSLNPSTSPAAAPAPTPTPTSAPSPTPTPSPSVAPPEEIRRGSFRGLDGHDARGEAVLYRLGDGGHFLRLEEIDVDNGPGLRLYLVPGIDQTRPVDGSVFLGDLQGNQGSHNYAIGPQATAEFLAGDLTVLIWCEPFQVAIGGATLG